MKEGTINSFMTAEYGKQPADVPYTTFIKAEPGVIERPSVYETVKALKTSINSSIA